MIIVTSSFLKNSILEMFSIHTKKRLRFQSIRFQERFETLIKHCFCDGIEWTEELTMEIKLSFKFLQRSVGALCYYYATFEAFIK